MQDYKELIQEIENINQDIIGTIYSFEDWTGSISKEENANYIKNIIERIGKLDDKFSPLIDELSFIHADDELQFDRTIKLWLDVLTTSFDNMCDKFRLSSLKPTIINDYKVFKSSLRIVTDKIVQEGESTKINSGSFSNYTITSDECGLYYAFILSIIIYKLRKKEALVKHKVSYFYSFYDDINILPCISLVNINDFVKHLYDLNDSDFQNKIQDLDTGEINNELDFHLQYYVSNQGNVADWLVHTKEVVHEILSNEQRKVFTKWLDQKSKDFPITEEKDSNEIPQLPSIFNKSNNAFSVCIELMDYLEITIDGKANMKKGRAGKLMGLLIAIKNTPDMLKASYTEIQLLKIFNDHLKTKYKSVLKRSIGYAENLDDATRYIRSHLKK